jgi:hypothetical protein
VFNSFSLYLLLFTNKLIVCKDFLTSACVIVIGSILLLSFKSILTSTFSLFKTKLIIPSSVTDSSHTISSISKNSSAVKMVYRVIYTCIGWR